MEVDVEAEGSKASMKASNRRLELHTWQAAWDSYALAAAAVDQMSFRCAMEHKAKVLERAAMGISQGRKPLVAVLYDEVVRYAFRFHVGWLVCWCTFASAGRSGPTCHQSWVSLSNWRMLCR